MKHGNFSTGLHSVRHILEEYFIVFLSEWDLYVHLGDSPQAYRLQGAEFFRWCSSLR
jgi:hypothetical protein